MSHFFDRLQKEKELPVAATGRNSRPNPPDLLQPLLGNIREWLRDGERNGLLHMTQNPIQLRDEHSGAYEADSLGVDFGGGRLLKVEPRSGAGDQVEMHFRGCRKIGRIMLQQRGEQWWVWPKNSVRQLPVPWCSRSFLDLLEDMV
jgi:hypothetical protein